MAASVRERLAERWRELMGADPAQSAIDWLGSSLSFADLAERVGREHEQLQQLMPPATAAQDVRVGVQIENGPVNLINGLALMLAALPQAILPTTATPTEAERLDQQLELTHRIGQRAPTGGGDWVMRGTLPSGLHCWERTTPVNPDTPPSAGSGAVDPADPTLFLGTTSGTTSGVPGVVRLNAHTLLKPPDPHSPYELLRSPLLGEGLQNWSARLFKFLVLLRGGSLVIRPYDRPFEAGTIPDHCDGSPMQPSLLHRHLAWDDLGHCPAGFLLISGSDRVPMALRQAIASIGTVRLGITYATSQSGPLTWLPPEALLDEPDSVGWPIEGVTLEPVGPARLQRDGLVFREVIATVPKREPFNPGDLLAFSPTGQVIFGGRSNDVFLYASLLISPLEIEELIAAHPAVESCAAFGARSERYGGVPMAAVILKPGADAAATLTDLDGRCRQALGPRRPQRIHVVTSLPCGPTGKVLRRVLAEEHALQA